MRAAFSVPLNDALVRGDRLKESGWGRPWGDGAVCAGVNEGVGAVLSGDMLGRSFFGRGNNALIRGDRLKEDIYGWRCAWRY